MARAWPTRIEFLGRPLDAIDMEATVQRCLSMIALPGTSIQVSVNAAKLVSCERDPAAAAFIDGADLVNADGQAVVWGARFVGHHIPERVAGIDLMSELLTKAEELAMGIYVLGGRESTLTKAIAQLRRSHPALEISGAEHGYYDLDAEHEVAERIGASGARLLFVAMSSRVRRSSWRATREH